MQQANSKVQNSASDSADADSEVKRPNSDSEKYHYSAIALILKFLSRIQPSLMILASQILGGVILLCMFAMVCLTDQSVVLQTAVGIAAVLYIAAVARFQKVKANVLKGSLEATSKK